MMNELKAVSEKQLTYAMKVRADALNDLEQFRTIFEGASSFYGQNLLSIYSAGRDLILGLTDASSVIEKAGLIANETKGFAAKWEQHYNFCKQNGRKPCSARFVVEHAPASAFRFLNASAFN